jgi:hypothetical protein
MDSSTALYRRARALRDLASRIDRVDPGVLLTLAGDDTWRGPLADVTVARIADASRRCRAAAEQLRSSATALERTAVERAAVERAGSGFEWQVGPARTR